MGMNCLIKRGGKFCGNYRLKMERVTPIYRTKKKKGGLLNLFSVIMSSDIAEEGCYNVLNT